MTTSAIITLGLKAPVNYIITMGLSSSEEPIPASAPSKRTFDVNSPAENIGYKTPEEVLNFSFDNWEDVTGYSDLITASEWSVESTDIVIVSDSFDAANFTTTVILSGGVSTALTESVYIITNKVTTAAGLVFYQSFRLIVREYNV